MHQKNYGIEKYKINFRGFLVRATKTEEDVLQSLMADVEDETPFNAMDFFTVDTSLLTSILSTLVTYTIILKQF